MASSLTLLAGPEALGILRERGLRPQDVDVVPGASGGPKWLVLGGLDRFIFGDFLSRSRSRPLHLIGSSIGSWRLACAAQKDPVRAFDRAHSAYIEQRYPRRPPPALVTETTARIIEELLGTSGAEEILGHAWARLHVIATECRGLLGSDRPLAQKAGVALAAVGNLVSRRTLSTQVRRAVLHAGGDPGPFRDPAGFPTAHLRLTRDNLGAALLASASIPLWLEGVRLPGEPGRVYRDGGVVDYHLDLDFGPGDGIVLYPHFYQYVVPGWFDKVLPWRRARPANFRRALILAPSPEFVARLPHGKIPDREDFANLGDSHRIRSWRTTLAASAELADELRELLETGRLAERVQPLRA